MMTLICWRFRDLNFQRLSLHDIYILASHKGISFTHKGFLNEEKGHLFLNYLLLFKDSSLKEEELNYSKYYEKVQSLMELFMCRKFVFIESAFKFFISLIHLFTKVSGQNTKYEIYRNENELYEIEWSYGRSLGKNWFKNYFLKKSSPFNSTIKNKIKNIDILTITLLDIQLQIKKK